jgi:hypothetical protein
MDTMLRPISERMLVWLDDALTHAQNESELFATLHMLFSLCRENGLLLHAEKCDLFRTQVLWCRRILCAEGVRFELKHLIGLTSVMRDNSNNRSP